MRAALVALVALLSGCAALHSNKTAPPAPPATTQPAPAGPQNVLAVSPQAEQVGSINTAVQGLTGVQVQNALPLGLMPLMAWVLWLSHRREVLRLRLEILRVEGARDA